MGEISFNKTMWHSNIEFKIWIIVQFMNAKSYIFLKQTFCHQHIRIVFHIYIFFRWWFSFTCWLGLLTNDKKESQAGVALCCDKCGRLQHWSTAARGFRIRISGKGKRTRKVVAILFYIFCNIKKYTHADMFSINITSFIWAERKERNIIDKRMLGTEIAIYYYGFMMSFPFNFY